MKLSVRFLAAFAMLAIIVTAIPAWADPGTLTEEELKQRKMVITDNYVNMRGGYAGTAGHKEIINWGSGLMKGETVYFLNQHGNWYFVCRQKKINGEYQCGWVWGDYVKFKDSSTNASANASGGSGHVGGTPASELTKKKLRETTEATKVINTLSK